MHRTPSSPASRMSVDALLKGIPFDTREPAKVQGPRGIVTLRGVFGGVEWRLRLKVTPAAELNQRLATLLKKKNWSRWSECTHYDLRAASGRIRPSVLRAQTLTFLQQRLNILHRFLMGRRHLDDQLTTVVRRFSGGDLANTKRDEVVRCTVRIVRTAYPDQWARAGLPTARTIANPESFVHQHMGSLSHPLTKREYVIAARTLQRADNGGPRRAATCQGCNATVALDEFRDHIRACTTVHALSELQPQPHTRVQHWTSREEAARRRLIRKSR